MRQLAILTLLGASMMSALIYASPTPKPPEGATAECRDGTYSFSAHRRGTCSHHGGVKVWLKAVPPR